MRALQIVASLVVAALALALASCNGGYTSTASSGTASIRFINGSPDVTPFDVLLNGKVIATNVQYGQITAYQTQAVGTSPLPAVSFVKTGTQISIFNTSGGASPSPSATPQSFQLGTAPGTKLTIVIEGRAAFVGSLGLNIGAFVEPTITNASGQYAVVYHHASPAAAVMSPNGIAVGQVALQATPLYSFQGELAFSSIGGTSTSILSVTAQPAFVGPPGVGFFAGPVLLPTATPIPTGTGSPTPTPSPSTTPSPSVTALYAVIVPGPPVVFPSPTGNPIAVTGVDSTNINQTLPYNNDQTLFVYLIDDTASPTGVQLIDTFTN